MPPISLLLLARTIEEPQKALSPQILVYIGGGAFAGAHGADNSGSAGDYITASPDSRLYRLTGGLVSHHGAPPGRLQEIAAFIATVYDIQNFPIVIAEADYDNEIVRIQLYKGLPQHCPYDVREGDYRLCAATAAYERELVKKCNPRYKAYLTRTKAIGDDCCELTIERDPDYKG